MALLKINGVDMPAPSDLNIGIQDISKGERNANGNMIIERITTKRKLELSWSYLSKTDLAQIYNAISAVFFDVIYTDPQDDAAKTGTFYAGDRKCGILDFKNGVPRYKDVSVNFIER